MAKIVSAEILSQEKVQTHKIEVTVEFDEPVTFYEAQDKVTDAIREYMNKNKETV